MENAEVRVRGGPSSDTGSRSDRSVEAGPEVKKKGVY